MAHDAIWDRAYYKQSSNPRFISVDEALRLRDQETLKTGDLFCCNNDCNVRLGPRRAFKRRTGSRVTTVRACFRRLPGARRSRVERKECQQHADSRKKGETWKHSRVLDVIEEFLLNQQSEPRVVEVKRLGGFSSITEARDEADLLILHNSDENLPSSEIRLICRFQNLRRANNVIRRFDPDIIFIDMHRWRDGDVDFIEYIHQSVQKEYKRLSQLDETDNHRTTIHSITYTYPNLGFHEGGGLGFGRGGTIQFDSNNEDNEQYDYIHGKLSNLLKAIESHNYWAISTPGCTKYHLRNLRIGEFGHRFYNYIPGIVGDDHVQSFPASISLMMQDNYANHQTNHMFFNSIVTGNDESAEAIKKLGLSRSLFELDGQEGYQGISIGQIQSEFLVSNNDLSPFRQSNITFEEWTAYVTKLKDVAKQFGTNYRNNHMICTLNQATNRYELRDFESKPIIDFDPDSNEIDGYLVQVLYHLAIPDLNFWHELNLDEQQRVFKQVKIFYRKLCVFQGRLMTMPLLDIELDKLPKRLIDEEKIYEFISKNEEEFEDGQPMQPYDYFFLKWVIHADQFFQQINAPIVKDILHAWKFSTEELVEEVTLELPLFIQDMFDGQGDISDEIINIILSARGSEEE
ncbi:MAG: hypothetical protein ACPHUK_08775 [Candidatus Poseidoniaceae archaeon]